MIVSSPSLMNYDKDLYQEIVCSSSWFNGAIPPAGVWAGIVTLLDNTGSIISGWPNGAGTSVSGRVMPSAAAVQGTVLSGTPYGGGSLYAWATSSGDSREGFPEPAPASVTSGTAVGDVDGDGALEIVMASSDDKVHCFDVGCGGSFDSSLRLDWPTFRGGNTRTGCFYPPVTTDVEEDLPAVPEGYALYQNVPNPFNPITTIRFDLPRRGHVNLSVYDVKGGLVAVLAERELGAGRIEITWDGKDGGGRAVTSGVYFYRLETGSFVSTRKMVLLR